MADDADRAQKDMEFQEQVRSMNRRRHVSRANDYCEDCGELIEGSRLKAVPYATRCIHCQSEHERMEKQYGSRNPVK